jgi:hypothetical protein
MFCLYGVAQIRFLSLEAPWLKCRPLPPSPAHWLPYLNDWINAYLWKPAMSGLEPRYVMSYAHDDYLIVQKVNQKLHSAVGIWKADTYRSFQWIDWAHRALTKFEGLISWAWTIRVTGYIVIIKLVSVRLHPNYFYIHWQLTPRTSRFCKLFDMNY